jgi:hypothetical protein
VGAKQRRWRLLGKPGLQLVQRTLSRFPLTRSLPPTAAPPLAKLCATL